MGLGCILNDGQAFAKAARGPLAHPEALARPGAWLQMRRIVSQFDFQITEKWLQAFADAFNRHDADAILHGCDLFRFREGKIALKNSYRKHRPPSPRR